MPNMDIDSVIQKLKKLFAASLPEFYRRRIVFWYDEDREYEDKLDDISIPDVKLVILGDRNNFALKKLLVHDDTLSNFLVYSPVSYEKQEDNWLLNIELYSEPFRADRTSDWMDEMGIENSLGLRRWMKEYKKFFNSQERRAKISALGMTIVKEQQLHLCVMAALCGIKEATPNAILRAVLAEGLYTDGNKIYNDFVSYGADKPFWAFVRKFTGYNQELGNIKELACHILLTATTRTMKAEYLSGLEKYISTPHQAYCYDFIADWLNRRDNLDVLREVAGQVEGELRLSARFSKIKEEEFIRALEDTACFPCINECILTKLMTDICNDNIPSAKILALIEKRRTLSWYDETACYFDGITQIAYMYEFYLKHAHGFHTVEAKQLWREYTEDYYKMDTYYRQFHLCFQRSLVEGNYKLDDLFKHVAEKVEGLYSHWFLDELGESWTNACIEDMQTSGKIFGVDHQESFYSKYIKSADSRVFVIVSDALRYEVAASLTEQLKRETQSQVELKNCEAIFPTVTKFGMAALLPHSKLSIVEKANGVQILADGQSTESINRERVLKIANPLSMALQYKNLIGMKRQEMRALVKGMEVVYIYHDKIDEASHTSDSEVFSACDTAINEIKNIVRLIVQEFGGTNIYITADHGFLYTYSPLREDDKVDKTTPSEEDVEIDRRYLIKRKGKTPDFLLPVRFMDGKTDYEIYAPRENIRIKKKGGGMNFVHGGLSLQEMVVPVIEYHFLRNDYKDYKLNRERYDTKPVTVGLYSASRKITNLIFSLNFYQKEAVSDNREAVTYLLYFVDSTNVQISDTQKIVADKTSPNTNDRAFRCGFNLKSQKYDKKATYYLVIADESGLQAPQREEFQIDIAFSVDDYDW